jgi:hypothetical protein
MLAVLAMHRLLFILMNLYQLYQLLMFLYSDYSSKYQHQDSNQAMNLYFLNHLQGRNDSLHAFEIVMINDVELPLFYNKIISSKDEILFIIRDRRLFDYESNYKTIIIL